MIATAWSVLFIAWPYLVDQVPRPQRLLVERSWYGLRFAVPALAGFLCLPFIARYRRRPVALAVAAACLACASEKHADDLRAIVLSKAGITLREIKAALTARGIMVKALSTIADMLHRLDLSHKKRA